MQYGTEQSRKVCEAGRKLGESAYGVLVVTLLLAGCLGSSDRSTSSANGPLSFLYAFDAPTGKIVSPVNGATVSGTVRFKFQITTNKAESDIQVRIRVNNVLRVTWHFSYEKAGTFQEWLDWDSKEEIDGTYQVVLQLTDQYTPVDNIAITIANSGSSHGQPPQVRIASPKAGGIVSGLVNVSAEATADAGVAHVDFFIDDVPIGRSPNAPYAAAWLSTQSTDGEHKIRARAEGTNGATADSEITVTSKNSLDRVPPKAAILQPSEGSTLSGKFYLAVSASDEHTLRHIQLYVDAVGLLEEHLDQPQWQKSIQVDSARFLDGEHTINVHVTDDAGNVAVVTKQVTFSNGGSHFGSVPSGKFVAPTGDRATGLVTLQLETSAEVPIRGVWFHANHEFLYADDDAPYKVAVDTAQLRNGPLLLWAMIVDQDGRVGVVQKTVDVENPPVPPADARPTAAILAPQSFTTLSGTFHMQVDASDDHGVAKVEFYLGEKLLTTKTSGPWEIDVDSRSFGTLWTVLWARVFDTAGNTVQPHIHVGIDNSSNGPIPNVPPPSVTLTQPTQLSDVQGTLVIRAEASANAGVREVRFYVDARQIGVASTAPYEVTLDTTTLSEGAHTLAAVAVDTAGQTARDEIHIFVIQPHEAPATPLVQIYWPRQGDEIQRQGEGYHMHGYITSLTPLKKVEYFLDGRKIDDLWFGLASPNKWVIHVIRDPVQDHLTKGWHTVTWKATNEAGLTGEMSVTAQWNP